MPNKYDRQWELTSVDNCRLPELIPDICEKCRDYDYCHRQMELDLEGVNRQVQEGTVLKGERCL